MIQFLLMLPILIVIVLVFRHFDGRDQWPKVKPSKRNKRRWDE